MSAGRPTDYKEENAEQAYKYCLLGADDKRLALLFGVCEATINNWKNAHPEFLESIIKGKQIADAEVAHALYNKAKGFEVPAVKIIKDSEDGIIEVPYMKYYPPDAYAAFKWLNNRDPERWKDKKEVEHSGEIKTAQFELVEPPSESTEEN